MSANPRMVVRDSAEGDRYVSTIVHWQHHEGGGEAHCLARLHRSADGGRVVAILSELRTNPGKGILLDVSGAAEALLAQVASEVSVQPDAVVWLAHHGTFSTYDQIEADTFTAVDLLWTGDHFEDSLARHRLLPRAEAEDLMRGISFRPLPEVMEELQGTVWYMPS